MSERRNRADHATETPAGGCSCYPYVPPEGGRRQRRRCHSDIVALSRIASAGGVLEAMSGGDGNRERPRRPRDPVGRGAPRAARWPGRTPPAAPTTRPPTPAIADQMALMVPGGLRAGFTEARRSRSCSPEQLGQLQHRGGRASRRRPEGSHSSAHGRHQGPCHPRAHEMVISGGHRNRRSPRPPRSRRPWRIRLADKCGGLRFRTEWSPCVETPDRRFPVRRASKSTKFRS